MASPAPLLAGESERVGIVVVGELEHELAERLRGLSLHPGDDVGVDVHGERDRRMAESFRDDLRRDSRLE